MSTLISWWGANHCRSEAPKGAWVCLMTYSAFLQMDNCQRKLILTWHLFWKLIPIESKQMILCFLLPQGPWWDFGLNGFGAQDVVSSLTEIHRTLVSEHLLHFLSHLKSEMFPTIPSILQVLQSCPLLQPLTSSVFKLQWQTLEGSFFWFFFLLWVQK